MGWGVCGDRGLRMVGARLNLRRASRQKKILKMGKQAHEEQCLQGGRGLPFPMLTKQAAAGVKRDKSERGRRKSWAGRYDLASYCAERDWRATFTH